MNEDRRFLRNTELLGRGGFGSAREIKFNGKVYVMKKAHSYITNNEIAREIAAIDSLPANHPNLTKYYGAIKHDGKWCLIFEKAESNMKGLKFTTVQQHLGALEGIKELHSRGIAHRDIKEGNMLRFSGVDGSDDVIKIADFGANYSALPGKQEFIRTEGYYPKAEYKLLKGLRGQGLTLSNLQAGRYCKSGCKFKKGEPFNPVYRNIDETYLERISSSFSDRIRRTAKVDQYKSVFNILASEPITADTIRNFIETYDPRATDIYAYGKVLENQKNISGNVPVSDVFIKRMIDPSPFKRPSIEEVIAEFKK